MSFTRFHDDPYRIEKQLEISTFSGRYMLDTPGPGTSLSFHEDPQMRLQKWGANLHSNTVNLESDMRGLMRRLNRNIPVLSNMQLYSVDAPERYYSTEKSFIEESRASHPAWMYKDLEQTRWEAPFLNPLKTIEPVFPTNISSRIAEKDNFVRNI